MRDNSQHGTAWGRRVLGAAWVAMFSLTAVVLADVIVATDDVSIRSGQPGITKLRLTPGETPVDAINGEITYDAAIISNMRVATDAGAEGFTALGNEVSPGVFRFVLYRNPAGPPMNPWLAVMSIFFDGVAGLPNASQTTVTYTIGAAARIDPANPDTAVSIAIGGPGGEPAPEAVSFPSFEVMIGANAIRDWELFE